MEKKLEYQNLNCALTRQLVDVLKTLKGTAPLNPTIERLLRDHPEVKEAARALGIELPERPLEGRGKVPPPKRTKKHS